MRGSASDEAIQKNVGRLTFPWIASPAPGLDPGVARNDGLQSQKHPRSDATAAVLSGVQLLPRHAYEAEDVIRPEGEARGLEAGLEVSRSDGMAASRLVRAVSV